MPIWSIPTGWTFTGMSHLSFFIKTTGVYTLLLQPNMSCRNNATFLRLTDWCPFNFSFFQEVNLQCSWKNLHFFCISYLHLWEKKWHTWTDLFLFCSFAFYSAYCGGLWLASLCVMCKMARLVDSEEAYQHYRDILNRGSAAFDKLLWNGMFKTSIRCVQYLYGKCPPET